MSTTKTIHQVHDKLFKLALSEIAVAREFFTTYLLKHSLERIDLPTLQLDNSAFITDLFKNHNSDVVYKVKLKNDSRDLLLLSEHLSTIDPKATLRLWRYQSAMIEGYLKQYPKKPTPWVYPLIYYTGHTRWIAPLDILPNWMAEPVQLIEVKKIPDEMIQERRLWGIVEYVFKHRNSRDYKGILNILMPWIKEIEASGEVYSLCENVLTYWIDGVETEDVETVKRELQNCLETTVGAKQMTLGQLLRAEGHEIGHKIGFQEGISQGINQGINQGESEMLIRQLKRRFYEVPANYLAKIKQANAETLLLWGERILDAKTLEEIFA